MSDSQKPIEELLSLWADEALDASGTEQLRERLRTDANARQKYVQWQIMHAALLLDSVQSHSVESHSVDGNGTGREGFGMDLSDRDTDDQTSVDRSVVELRRPRWPSSWGKLLAVAAGIMVCLLSARWAQLEWSAGSAKPVADGSASTINVSERSGDAEATSRGIALVTRLVDAEWEDSSQSVEVGEALVPGRLKLRSGYAQVEFFCGASVVLEGPAEMQLVSSTAAEFLGGRLRAQVPPAARGFEVTVDGMKVIDLGTEFGLHVTPNGASVQVFDGEVEVVRPNEKKQLVTAGQALEHDRGQLSKSSITPDQFVDLARLDSHAQGQTEKRYQRWLRHSGQLIQDDRLVAYYALPNVDRWQRKLKNGKAGPSADLLDGAIVGARRVSGRWPQKGGLMFKQPGDRVRVNIPGEFRSLSFACWVKIDSLDRWYNSLFLTDSYESGEPHWQILDTGQLFFSVRAGTPQKDVFHKVVLSPPFWNPTMSGKWLHLATTYDVDAKQTTHYLNGEVLHQESIPDHQLVDTTRIGMASLGNWSTPTKPDADFAIRNLNGAMDEFAIFSTALTADEIKTIYENGKP